MKRLLFIFFIAYPIFLFGCKKVEGTNFMVVNDTTTNQFAQVPGVVVVHSPKSSGKYRGTPSLVKLPNGHILSSNDVFGTGVPNATDIFISKDNGVSWSYVSTVTGAVWSGLFYHQNKLFLLGADVSQGANLVIRGSTDEGLTWSAPTIIVPGACHGSSTPVLFANNRIYKAYEFHDTDLNGKWMSGNKSYIVSASQTADLLNPASWLKSDALQKPAWLDGTGWLETNAVIGPDGKIKGISRLASMEGIYAGYYSLSSDAQIEAGSGKKIQFWGGSSKFNIRYDSNTQKYWALVNYAPAQFKADNRSAGGIRNVLALSSSTDLETWVIESIVLANNDVENVGFQYVDWVFDNNDILFVSRTAFDDGLGGADNYHNANFMTFHKITNYASTSTPVEWQNLLPGNSWNGGVQEIDMSAGKGDTKANPALISHPGQLVYLSEQVYKGNSFENKYFKMTNDIDLNHFNYLPIGWYITTTVNKPFSGNFDGDGHQVLNLKINRNDDTYTSSGLFGYTLRGSITNLGIGGQSEILVGGVTGGIVAYANATVISGCFNEASIKGVSFVGGILGYGVSAPKIRDCYNTGVISLQTTTTVNKNVGGIAGYLNTGYIQNSYNAGTISTTLTSATGAGAISGKTNSLISNCYFLSGTIANTNNNEVELTETVMKNISTVNLLNNGRTPLLWKKDDLNLNNGYPILNN